MNHSVCLETEEDLKDELGEVGKRQGTAEVIFSQLSTLYFILMAMRNHIRWSSLSAEELMLLNRGVGEDSRESLGLQGDQTSQSSRK